MFDCFFHDSLLETGNVSQIPESFQENHGFIQWSDWPGGKKNLLGTSRNKNEPWWGYPILMPTSIRNDEL
jgi:hypothetical protein